MIYLPFFCVTLWDKKLICRSTKKFRKTMAGRGHQILPQPGAAQEPSAHQRPMATNSEVHSSIMTGGGNPNYGLRRRDTIIKIIITVTWSHLKITFYLKYMGKRVVIVYRNTKYKVSFGKSIVISFKWSIPARDYWGLYKLITACHQISVSSSVISGNDTYFLLVRHRSHKKSFISNCKVI